MTDQIQSHPTRFECTKYFGPFMASVQLPDDAVDALIKMTDDIIADEKTQSHGKSLAGVIDKELKVYKSDMDKSGVDQLLESCVKSYVLHCAKQHGFFDETHIFTTKVNSAWVVSQYENEYNPIHNHNGCEISGVIYLKTPDVKGRRNFESKKGKHDHDGDINFLYNAASQRNFDIFEKGLIQVSPNPGLLLMFPSYLLHTVYPFIGEGERRCLPFNATYRIVDKDKAFIAGDMSGLSNETFYEGKKNNE